jgi:hypothetical protein
MPIKISFGQQIKVFETGTVIQYNHENIVLELTGLRDTQTTLTFEIRFQKSTENKGILINLENGGNNRLIVNLINIDNKINHGNIEPIRIGSLDNKELFFSFRVTSGNETFPRTFVYTFYLGEEVNHG